VRPLHVKLLRDLWRLRAQAVAIALVIAAGVGMVVMSFGMIRSLEATRAAYYDMYRFAHVWAPVRRAPESLVGEARLVPGVAVAESRISAAATLDVPGVLEPVAARIHSLPTAGQPGVNRLVLRSGRLPDPRRPDEVVANEAFASGARLAPGDTVRALLYGNRVELRLVGTVLSPEYVYAVPPGQIFPDNRRFGTLWMGREPLAAALDLTDAFNELVVRTGPGAQQEEVIRRLDLLLAPYGSTGAYGRDLQISDRFVASEIDQLATTVEILPPVFLLVAAFLLNMVLARLVDTEREVIGLLKAFGYRDRDVMVHYGQLALLLSLGGLLIGFAFGTWLGRALAGLYQDFFTFPFLHFQAGLDVYLIAAAATLTAVLAGAALAVRRAAGLTPAEAMRPPTPPDFSGRATALVSAAGPDEPTRMILRGLVRRPFRSVMSVLGLSAALALYIASASATDNVDRMIELTFDQGKREDVTVTFAEARDARALHALERLPGVIRVEPFRAAPANLSFGHRMEREGLSGAQPAADLSRLIDLQGRVIEPPPQGALISGRLARQLGVEAGQTIRAAITDGERHVVDLRVAGIVESPLGASAYLDRATLNRLLRESDVISGAYLRVDARELPRIYAALKETPLIAGVTVQEAVLRGIRDTIAENMGIITSFNTGFAALIVLGIVYNSARISLSERARDLASLRVLGFRRGEVSFVLLGEQALLVVASFPFGIAMGIGLSRYMSEQFSSDLFTIPFDVNIATLAQGVLVVAAASTATALLIRNRTDRLDLVRALKTRE
jgi:putative ABC transport system permease protein